MKKVTAILLGTLIASSAALAQTNQVLSRNAVGYVKKTVEADKLDFITMTFEALVPGGNTISNVVPVASNNTALIVWNPTSQEYITYLRSKGNWGVAGSNVLPRGQSFFLRSPAGNNQQFFMMGEVPDRFSAPTTSVSVVEGISAVSIAYPVDTVWTSTAIASSLANNDQLIIWDYASQNYITYLKAKGAWGVASNLVIKPGQGAFIRKFGAGTTTWQQPKPYTWP